MFDEYLDEIYELCRKVFPSLEYGRLILFDEACRLAMVAYEEIQPLAPALLRNFVLESATHAAWREAIGLPFLEHLLDRSDVPCVEWPELTESDVGTLTLWLLEEPIDRAAVVLHYELGIPQPVVADIVDRAPIGIANHFAGVRATTGEISRGLRRLGNMRPHLSFPRLLLRALTEGALDEGADIVPSKDEIQSDLRVIAASLKLLRGDLQE